jgi:bifunctional enzyme CysN/CysC
MARSLFAEGDFLEVFVDTPLEVAEARDPKGLYKKARRGELPNFTGIDSEYQKPIQPDLVLNSNEMSVEDAAKRLIEQVVGNN